MEEKCVRRTASTHRLPASFAGKRSIGCKSEKICINNSTGRLSMPEDCVEGCVLVRESTHTQQWSVVGVRTY